MKKHIALALKESAKKLAEWMSRPKPDRNYPQLKFEVETVLPLSEFTGAAVLNKSDGKKALVFFYWSDWSKAWSHFIPKESHIYGMGKLAGLHQQVEDHNFRMNGEVN